MDRDNTTRRRVQSGEVEQGGCKCVTVSSKRSRESFRETPMSKVRASRVSRFALAVPPHPSYPDFLMHLHAAFRYRTCDIHALTLITV